MSVKQQYKGASDLLRSYWRTYGGWGALITSPFLHLSVVLTGLCVAIWWSGAWWERSISIIPAVLGFSIAAFTLVLGVGDEKFRRLLGLEKKEGEPSTLTNTSASLFHFIAIQVIALSVALIASSKPLAFVLTLLGLDFPAGPLGMALLIMSKCFRAFGFFLLAYALFSAVAASMSIFKLATIFSRYATLSTKEDKESQIQRSFPGLRK